MRYKYELCKLAAARRGEPLRMGCNILLFAPKRLKSGVNLGSWRRLDFFVYHYLDVYLIKRLVKYQFLCI